MIATGKATRNKLDTARATLWKTVRAPSFEGEGETKAGFRHVTPTSHELSHHSLSKSGHTWYPRAFGLLSPQHDVLTDKSETGWTRRTDGRPRIFCIASFPTHLTVRKALNNNFIGVFFRESS